MNRRYFFRAALAASVAAVVVPKLPKGESVTQGFPYKLGLKPSPESFRLRLGNYLNTSTLPTPPDEFGHENLVNWWGMLGNDVLGDCAIAGPYHALQLWNAEAGRHFPINTARVVSTYSDITGYDPSLTDEHGNNPTDHGSNLDDVAKYWQKTGFPDSSGNFHKIDTYVALEPGDVEQLFLAAYLFDGVGVGIHMPSEWMAAFEAKKPWDALKKPHIRGGHLVTGVARRNGNLVVVTWGALQEMTPAGYEQQSMETLIYLDRDKLVNGKDINGFDFEKLQHDIWSVAQCDEA